MKPARTTSQENRIRAQKGLDPVPEVRYRLIQDEDCHWYVIRTDQIEEFERWEQAIINYEPWERHDFNEDRIGCAPGCVTFPSFEVE